MRLLAWRLVRGRDPVLILNGGGLPTLERCRTQYPAGRAHLGRLARPRHISRLRATLDAGFKVGIDCDAFSNWSLDRFVAMIGQIERQNWGQVLSHTERIAALAPIGLDGPTASPSWPVPRSQTPLVWHENLLFVCVPDVPFDAEATARRWSDWAPLMSHLPLALCVQDGATVAGIPWAWPNLRCLFMAGSTDFKLSAEMAAICREGKRRGLWIHAGRVNTRDRIRHMLGLGFVDSIDGSAFDKFRDTHLPWALNEVSTRPAEVAAPALQGLLDLPTSASPSPPGAGVARWPCIAAASTNARLSPAANPRRS
jgi:hypothetical protein